MSGNSEAAGLEAGYAPHRYRYPPFTPPPTSRGRLRRRAGAARVITTWNVPGRSTDYVTSRPRSAASAAGQGLADLGGRGADDGPGDHGKLNTESASAGAAGGVG